MIEGSNGSDRGQAYKKPSQLARTRFPSRQTLRVKSM